jgi:serine/threonine protein kinase
MSAMIETGTILQNRYRVEKQIGQGGMGNVYVATDERFNSVVAIKETIFEDANLRKAFEREARLLNSLKHAALPRVSDHFDESKGQFLVMEYIAGDDLAAMMEKNGEAFPLETVLNWANQLCDALEYLHAQDIIHRDIKPQNLKLTPNGQIVLLDFGLAKGNATDSAHQTAAKSIFGFSRSYASLEQIQGAGTEPRSDLYSLGATLYHLLTGIPPADALTRAMNVLNKQSDPLIPANLVNRQIPCGVAEVLQKAMALNANERPESAAAMRRMLDECDKTVDLFAADSIGANLLAADFLTQETKIIGAKTNLDAVESEGATKIATENSTDEKKLKTTVADDDAKSKVTVLRPFTTTQRPKRSKILVGAAALAGVLLVGLVLATVYTMSFDDAQSSVNAEETKSANANNFSAGKSENANIASGNAVEDNTAEVWKETINKPPVEPLTTPVETTKTETKEAKKPTQKAPPTAKSNVQNTDSENIVVNGDTVEMGDVIIDENGIRDKKTGKSLIPTPPKPGALPEAPRTLTPEQIRRLEKINERLEKRKNRVIVLKTPVPPEMP